MILIIAGYAYLSVFSYSAKARVNGQKHFSMRKNRTNELIK